MYVVEKKIPKNFAEIISKQVEQFNRAEIDCLIEEFYKLDKESIKLDRGLRGVTRIRFRTILHSFFRMTDDRLMDRVFSVFDKDNDGVVGIDEWIEGLAVILRGTFEEKIKFCFRVYDLNDDKYISRDEMTRLLDSSLIRHPSEEDPDEGIKDLVEITFRKMDADHDGRVSLSDFEKSVKEENLLMEAFGICLPDRTGIAMFEKYLFRDLDSP